MGVGVPQEWDEVAVAADLLFERQGDAAIARPAGIGSRVDVPERQMIKAFVRSTVMGEPAELDGGKVFSLAEKGVKPAVVRRPLASCTPAMT